jgi:hypothetical protein
MNEEGSTTAADRRRRSEFMARRYNGISLDNLINSTRALLIFCRSHDREGLRDIEACLGFLEQNNFKAAFRWFKLVPFGGMGTFVDWFPPVKFPNEDPEYVDAVFNALCMQWIRLMRIAGGEIKPQAEYQQARIDAPPFGLSKIGTGMQWPRVREYLFWCAFALGSVVPIHLAFLVCGLFQLRGVPLQEAVASVVISDLVIISIALAIGFALAILSLRNSARQARSNKIADDHEDRLGDSARGL